MVGNKAPEDQFPSDKVCRRIETLGEGWPYGQIL